ncbi:MAG: metallophosphoesterase [Dehalococcoidia bacterium]|jgi:3',5'-cyclic AMP phosphodiesterase CpdA
MKLVHISDLHVAGNNFVPEWAEKLIEIVNRLAPDILVVTGDITDSGYEHEYDRAIECLDSFKTKARLVVPGNHDARNEGDVLFEGFFETRFPFYEDDDVVILGIDSSQPDLDDGHVGREHYHYIESCAARRDHDGKQRVTLLAMHHHLIPIPGTGRERNIPLDAGDVLKKIVESQIQFVLSGHKHMPWIWKLENSYFVTAGTATTRRLKGRSFPSFNVLEIDEDRVLAKEVNVADGTMTEKLVVPRRSPRDPDTSLGFAARVQN